MIQNSQDALKVLGLKSDATEGDIKIAFRKLAQQYHPDVNKADTAEAEFKKINEAYQFLQKNGTKANDDEWNRLDWSAFHDEFLNRVHINFSRPYTTVFETTYHNVTDPVGRSPEHATIQVTFEEMILGCTKQVTYNRKIMCAQCLGKCYKVFSGETKCSACGGEGHRKYGQDKLLPCTTCRGTGKTQTRESCSNCNGRGTTRSDNTVEVNVPAGVTNGHIILVPGAGDYNPSGLTQLSAAKFKVITQSHTIMSRAGNNVVSTIELSLLDALKGTTIKVATVHGERTLKIPPGRKHADEVIAKGLGVPNLGSHIFVLDVKYPENIQSLIDFLESKEQGVDNNSSKE